MSEQEVLAVLGTPTESNSVNVLGVALKTYDKTKRAP